MTQAQYSTGVQSMHVHHVVDHRYNAALQGVCSRLAKSVGKAMGMDHTQVRRVQWAQWLRQWSHHQDEDVLQETARMATRLLGWVHIDLHSRRVDRTWAGWWILGLLRKPVTGLSMKASLSIDRPVDLSLNHQYKNLTKKAHTKLDHFRSNKAQYIPVCNAIPPMKNLGIICRNKSTSLSIDKLAFIDRLDSSLGYMQQSVWLQNRMCGPAHFPRSVFGVAVWGLWDATWSSTIPTFRIWTAVLP
ncbi:hypothetical protein DFH08DRAFT_806253 [Mycena albidolilacea]|uniref:Uncharacterized protein n=1 Tax=Mycena albidolilacea TaxID=1033008 RepID=A0AAD7A7W5_9AGAR|nr:hypothetical protein DFH08DRAFT_806253 [Mycena albidolilacea]